MVDCDRVVNSGCNGGLEFTAFPYVHKNGITFESLYPYSGNGRESCRKFTSEWKNSSEHLIKKDNPQQMLQAVLKGPVSVAIEADRAVFQSYETGVITSTKCGTNLDHAVLVVGYGTEKGQDYWLVKNSWGASWGEEGYVKLGRNMSKNDEGICGVQHSPSQPDA